MSKGGKHCVKRRNCKFCAISPFVLKNLSAAKVSKSVYMRERVNLKISQILIYSNMNEKV